jgi:hypothetical protein
MSSAPFPAFECKLHLALAIRALGTRSPFAPRRREFIQAIGKKHPDAPALEREVTEIQSRLGTPTERPEDLERARAAAHRLANLICTELLTQDLAAGGA